MIRWTNRPDTDGIPTDTRTVEIDPPELPEWRKVVLGLTALGCFAAVFVGFLAWLFTTPWALACYVLALCSWVGLKLEEADEE